jgi:hypothetical protein
MMESRGLPEALGDLATKDKRKSIYAQHSQVADLSVGKEEEERGVIYVEIRQV